MNRTLARTRRGFTLAEILVVIIIIGVLMAVAIPRLLNSLNSGRDSSTQQVLTTITQDIGNKIDPSTNTFSASTLTPAAMDTVVKNAEGADFSVPTAAGAASTGAKVVSFAVASTYVSLAIYNDATKNCWQIQRNTDGTKYYKGTAAAASCTAGDISTTGVNTGFPAL